MGRYPYRKSLNIRTESSQLEYELMVHLRWLGGILYSIRQERNMLQKDFAKFLGVPQCQISHLENGGVDLKLSTLLKIASKLEVDLHRLIPKKEDLEFEAFRAGGWGVKRSGPGRLKQWR